MDICVQNAHSVLGTVHGGPDKLLALMEPTGWGQRQRIVNDTYVIHQVAFVGEKCNRVRRGQRAPGWTLEEVMCKKRAEHEEGAIGQ